MKHIRLKISTVILALGVIFGAFGAHALKVRLSPDSLDSWKTGVMYLFIHGLAMLVFCMSSYSTDKVVRLSWTLFLVGIFFFSGSIFLLSTRSVSGIDFRWLGPITPIGGLLFIVGWLNLLRISNDEVR